MGCDNRSLHYFSTTFNNVLGFHVLFDSWYVPTEKDLAWTCVVLFIIGFCYEGVKVFKTVITIWMRNSRVIHKGYCHRLISKYHILLTITHLLQVVISYALMLAVMTFNSWMFLAVILGFVMGYMLLSPLAIEQLEDDDHSCCN